MLNRRFPGALAWCQISRHRIRTCFYEFIITSRTGTLPLILGARPTPAGERLWVFCAPIFGNIIPAGRPSSVPLPVALDLTDVQAADVINPCKNGTRPDRPGYPQALLSRGRPLVRPPKSPAGVRVVDFPVLIVPDVREHLGWLPSASALVFATSTGTPLAHSNFRRRVWVPALAVAGLEGVHLHDLPAHWEPAHRQRGPNLDELMTKKGRESERAALVYLHSTGSVSVPWPMR
jgi:hypothetical protein